MGISIVGTTVGSATVGATVGIPTVGATVGIPTVGAWTATCNQQPNCGAVAALPG